MRDSIGIEGAAGLADPASPQKSRLDFDPWELASASPFGEIVGLFQEFDAGLFAGDRILKMPPKSRGVRLD